MVKELLRNGGFELGDTNFWAVAKGELVIEDTEIVRGLYSGKIVGDDEVGDLLSVSTKDYIDVSEKEIYRILGWLKGGKAASTQALRIATYDNDLVIIGYEAFKTATSPVDWTLFSGYMIIPQECSYIRPYILGYAEVATPLYIDSFSLQRLDTEKLAVVVEELISTDDAAVKTDEKGAEFFTGIWKEAEYFLSVSKLTATGGNTDAQLNVKIESYDPTTELWRDAMVFQEVDETEADPSLHTQYKSLDSNLGWKQRVSYTTVKDATSMECDFKVGVVFKR